MTYYIGLMSGTSLDGVDAVLIQMDGAAWQGALAHSYLPYPDDIKTAVLALQQRGHDELHQAAVLSQRLSRIYAQTVLQLLAEQDLQAADIAAIGCHGQTIRHAPELGYSLQIADWSLLAELTGINVIGDFRSRDLAAGGQGAPLVPAFHAALFTHPEETRVLANIGGISNISVLRPNSPILGFDTGPGNMLMDAWVQTHFNLPYDADSRIAKQGKVLPELLQILLSHPYFHQAAPKSTGRDLFSFNWLAQYLNGTEAPQDVLRTLLELTAVSLSTEIAGFAPKAVYVCGGGVYNPLLLERLPVLLPQSQWHSTTALNLDPQWVEAAAFAWLAARRLLGLPSNAPDATGAKGPRVLGAIYQA